MRQNEHEQFGIEYTVFDYHKGKKQKVLHYRPAPGNIGSGINLLESKLGISLNDSEDLKKIMHENRKRIIKGTLLEKLNRGD